MRKFVYVVIIFLFVFLGIRSPVDAGYCNENNLDCDFIGVDLITGENQYNCHWGVCCEMASNCPEGCFLPGTLVKSSTGSKKIENIKVGDKVASFEDGKITQSKVSLRR